jgi:hypothetical protein
MTGAVFSEKLFIFFAGKIRAVVWKIPDKRSVLAY